MVFKPFVLHLFPVKLIAIVSILCIELQASGVTVTDLRIEIGHGMNRSGSFVSAHCVGGKGNNQEI